MKRVLWLFVGVFLIFSCGEKSESQTALPAPKIKVVKVKAQNVQLEKDFVAQVYGKVDIPIRARTEGYLEGVHFQEGKLVKKGELLYTVDQDPFREAVNAATSQLAEAKVALTQAENDLARYQPLAEINAVSQKDLDAAIAKKDAAEAAVNAAQASLNFQQIQLGYTQIKSPIDGLIGKTNAKVGEFVGRNPNPVILNTVSLIDSVRVEFFLSENDYLSLFREYQEHPEQAKAQLPLQLVLSDGSIFDQVGYVDFIDRQIDASTGTILIQATFPNPDRLIRPGQFARVRAIIQEVENGLIVPQRTVSEFQGRFFVFKVDSNNVISRYEVEILGKYKDYFLIKSGVSDGDRVVLEGLQMVRNGMTIEPEEVEFQSQFNQ
ncbi:efflux RND transporter periplasmic adaptor subunit [Algoriphagus limi]|uniref:Efflux RND transporter periplasmic adaptor subunit n=1 Tax=Algoriphagus limi TaxID=2975273 RepID=A0ABT2G5Y3_9BACT|nr:efflux RND transporter periplasmic adaptor subunit [Algoriphagus limi]MCS5490682.1 efflux RND transporter periplasmic adaptor subunit [Algoriphagus limi]